MTERRDCPLCRWAALLGVLLSTAYVCWLVAIVLTRVWEKTA